MDPTSAIITPWAQYGILGSVVIALGTTVYMQWRHIVDQAAAHLADVKGCGDKTEAMLAKKIESDNALANAIERLTDRVKP